MPIRSLLLAVICLLFFGMEVHARRYEMPTTPSVQETLKDLKYSVENHETELRILEEKLINQEEILESLNRKVLTNKESSAEKTTAVAAKVASFEKENRNLKKQVTELTTLVSLYKQKFEKIEQLMKTQNKNIEHLQSAMGSLVDAMQADVTPEPQIYRVNSGDSLGLIAQKHKTTVKKLKELNHLTSDRIIVGQKLKLPES